MKEVAGVGGGARGMPGVNLYGEMERLGARTQKGLCSQRAGLQRESDFPPSPSEQNPIPWPVLIRKDCCNSLNFLQGRVPTANWRARRRKASAPPRGPGLHACPSLTVFRSPCQQAQH